MNRYRIVQGKVHGNYNWFVCFCDSAEIAKQKVEKLKWDYDHRYSDIKIERFEQYGIYDKGGWELWVG